MDEEWAPKKTFEDEMMSIQPDYDLIFGHEEKETASMAAATLHDEIADLQIHEIPDPQREVNIVQKVLLNNKRIGRRIAEEDLETEDTRETETLAMLRNIGLEPSIDEPLNSKKTLPAMISNEPYEKANIPILLDESYFKLKPKKSHINNNEQPNDKSDSDAAEKSRVDDQLKTLFTDTDNNNSQNDEINNEKVQSAPKNPPRDSPEPLICNGHVRKRKKHTVAINIARNRPVSNDNSQCSVKSTQLNRNDENYCTPKELYLKKRGNLAS